jgi:hypothetical protein
MTLRRKLLSLGAILAGVLSTACPDDPNWVTPPAGAKQAVTFKVGNNVLVAQNGNSKFEVDQPESTASGIVNARFATIVQATVLATNSVTGVKSLDVVVTDPGGQSTTAHVDGTPNSSGELPTSLLSIGTHPGFPDDKVLRIAAVAPGGKLVATAVSGDGTPSTIVLDYIPWGEPYAEFQVSPYSISSGGEAELTWNSSFANLTIDNGIGAVGPKDKRKVKPASTTTYHLTATNPFGSNQYPATVSVGGSAGGSVKITYKNPEGQNINVPSTVTITYTGVLQSPPAPGNQADTQLNAQPVTTTFPKNQPWSFVQSFTGLAAGTWQFTVSAVTDGRGPWGTLVCNNVTVPGATTATQSAVPNCS